MVPDGHPDYILPNFLEERTPALGNHMSRYESVSIVKRENRGGAVLAAGTARSNFDTRILDSARKRAGCFVLTSFRDPIYKKIY